MGGGGYDIAQICLNGHMVNNSIMTDPGRSENFCSSCGEKTITKCPSCSAEIRSGEIEEGLPIGSFYTRDPLFEAPAFCYSCGKPYPWTEAKLKAAQELSDELDNLTPEEKSILKKSLDDIIRDTPQTTVAATRFKKLAAKAGKEAGEAFKSILVNVISEAAKKMIWP